ncbi:methyltransferase domain-containing protein [Geobacter pelophilus]|uniref:Methyltransferase domain-containing protein n=1 Tax=Geoanaerobacter pelophilus TaxID=60036 RepID=A0AAW4LA76_9BACT|nr:methyltransferase domain-containing protein [Geoanaerobacter pelophilus]
MLQDPTNQYIATILSHCDIRGKDVLEIGCGKGRITRDLAKYARRVVAVDPDACAIDYARTSFYANNVLFMQALKGVPDSSIGNFDIVIYTLSLHHVPETEMSKSLLSAAALLGKDGTIVVIEPGDGGSFTEAKERFGAGSGDERPAREAAIRNMLEMNGWTMGETIAFRTQFRFDDDDDFLSSMLPNYPQQPESFVNDVRRFLEQHRTADGIILEADRRLNVLRPSEYVNSHD